MSVINSVNGLRYKISRTTALQPRLNFYNVVLYLRTKKEFLTRPKFLLPFVEKLVFTFVFMVIKFK